METLQCPVPVLSPCWSRPPWENLQRPGPALSPCRSRPPRETLQRPGLVGSPADPGLHGRPCSAPALWGALADPGLHGRPSSALALCGAPVDPGLHGRPSSAGGWFWFSLLWGHCSFRLSLGAHKILLCPQKGSLCFTQSCGSPVIKSWWLPGQIPGGSPSLCWVPGRGAWCGVQDRHDSGRASLGLLFSSLRVTHLAGVGFDFIAIVPLAWSHCSLSCF